MKVSEERTGGVGSAHGAPGSRAWRDSTAARNLRAGGPSSGGGGRDAHEQRPRQAERVPARATERRARRPSPGCRAGRAARGPPGRAGARLGRRARRARRAALLPRDRGIARLDRRGGARRDGGRRIAADALDRRVDARAARADRGGAGSGFDGHRRAVRDHRRRRPRVRAGAGARRHRARARRRRPGHLARAALGGAGHGLARHPGRSLLPRARRRGGIRRRHRADARGLLRRRRGAAVAALARAGRRRLPRRRHPAGALDRRRQRRPTRDGSRGAHGVRHRQRCRRRGLRVARARPRSCASPPTSCSRSTRSRWPGWARSGSNSRRSSGSRRWRSRTSAPRWSRGAAAT